MDELEITNIIDSFMGIDICNEYYRMAYRKPIYISPVKIKSLKERLEEATMHEDCYFCIKRDICTKDVPKPCKYRYTEEERIADQASDNYGAILNGTYLHKTYRKKEEDNEMKKATSVQNIKNVKDISVIIENYPMERESKLTIVASTNDDIFKFEFEGSGPDLLRSCKAAGLFVGWEKDLKIKELKEEIKHLKEENKPKCENCLAGASYEEMYRNLRERIKKEYEKKIKELEKELGECLKLRDERKEESMLLKEENKHLREDIMRAKDELHSIKQEKSNLSEPTSRRDILKAAEMCVCGQREQDYGIPESNFQLIADLWNDYLFNSSKNDITITPTDVAMFMALMKIARIKNGGGSGDSFVDLAGYAACGGEIWYGGKKSIPEGE